MSGSNSNSVICEEVFFDGYQPSSDEIKDYALKIGINPSKEPHLLYLAREGLLQALPADWKICYNDQLHAHYYYNIKTKVTQWEHPLDDYYKELAEQARQKLNQLATTPSSGSAVDISEDASQLDSGIRSLQLNEELELNTSALNNACDTNHSHIKLTSTTSSSSASASLNSGGNHTANNKMTALGSANQKFLESKIQATHFHHSTSVPTIGLNLKPLKTSRFEVVKTNPQISLDMRMKSLSAGNNVGISDQADGFNTTTVMMATGGAPSNNSSEPDRKGFQISGMGAMFLKTNTQQRSKSNLETRYTYSGSASPNGVKGILRDSDIRRRLLSEEGASSVVDINLVLGGLAISSNNSSTDDKKSVRFNLDDIKMRSPEDEQSSSKKFPLSPEVSKDNSDGEDDPWDFNDEDDNFAGEQKHVKEVKLTPAIKEPILVAPKPKPLIKLSKPLMKSSSVDSSTNSISIGNVILKRTLGDKTNPSVLEKLKGKNLVKPLYEDTDSDSKNSSIRSFIKRDEYSDLVKRGTHDLEDLSKEHDENLQKLRQKFAEELRHEQHKLRDDMKSKLEQMKIELSKQNEIELKQLSSANQINGEIIADPLEMSENLIKDESERLQKSLNDELLELKKQHNEKLKQIESEYENQLTMVKQQFEEENNRKLEEYRLILEKQFGPKRDEILLDHKMAVDILQKNHAEMLQELERDLKSEEEILKKEHNSKLGDMREKLSREMELERQRMRESGEDRMYEKIRCEKRLLEDKYRCLKDKYGRLKTDVKLSLERRNRRREQLAAQQQTQHQNLTNTNTTTTTTTTGSETERSLSAKPSIGNSEIKSPSVSTSYPDPSSGGQLNSKPPTVVIGAKHPSSSLYPSKEGSREGGGSHIRERSSERQPRKMGIASKYIKHLQVHYQDDTTSISQSDTTISNNYTRGKYLPAPYSSDNGNSDSEAFLSNHETNNNATTVAGAGAAPTTGTSPGKDRQRKKQFSRTKSASTSRLNNSENYKLDRPCTPVENLRRQLQKLEDLEDQFPDNTLDATYHLRYPFSDISNDHAGTSSELEFFKHRIHLERDSVRRAKESLRTQRTNFRARQREIKQRHKQSTNRHSLDQLIQEEKELTEMEVNLHRTRALLGEKVIRLRHLEQSLHRIYEKDKHAANLDLLHAENNKEDATLSDLSSHSSSGFSSTDFASDTNALLNRRKDIYQDSSEAIKNLEILNVEIREILDIIGKQQIHGSTYNPPEFDWTSALYTSQSTHNSPAAVAAAAAAAAAAQSSLHSHHNLFNTTTSPSSIPSLSDRLETYRQLAAGRVQSSMGTAMMAANTIVSQNPRAVNYTTSLVERTRDLRNWLRQAKTEHEILFGANLGNLLTASSGISNINGGGLGNGNGSCDTTGSSSVCVSGPGSGGPSSSGIDTMSAHYPNL